MQREKVCAVLGLARAGVPAARFLAERGARVIGYDSRPLDQLGPQVRELEELGIELRTGDHGFAGLEECATIVLSPGLKIHHEPLLSVLAECELRGAEVIGELELAARHCPAPMIAVTGTKGKSTTTKLIHEMLLACGLQSVRAGNTGIPLIAELPQLTPESWAVVEVSSFQLERAPTFKPRIAVLLNLLPDHLDYHPTLEQYWNTKLKIFAHQDLVDIAILNVDDPNVAAYSRTLPPFDPLFETEEPDDKPFFLATTGRELKDAKTEQFPSIHRENNALSVCLGLYSIPVINVDEIPLRGQHNVSNVAAALGAVREVLSASKETEYFTYQAVLSRDARAEQGRSRLTDAIRSFQSLPHRLEVVGELNGVQFVNDSQATIPEAAMRALEAFPAPVALICGGKAKLENADAFDELGRVIAGKAALLATIGEAAPRIADAARRAGLENSKIVSAGTLDVAVRECFAQLPAGGTVVLSPACASFDQFASFEARGEAFKNAVQTLKNQEKAYPKQV